MNALTTNNTLPLAGHARYHVEQRRFSSWLNGRQLTQDNAEATLQRYIDEQQQHLAPRTVQLIKPALKKAFQALAGLKGNKGLYLWIDFVFKSVKVPRVDKKVYAKDVLSVAEMSALVKAASPRTGVIIRTLALSGLRVSELTKIKHADCERVKDTVHARVLGKGRKERTVQLPASLYAEIVATFKGGRYLFETVHGNALHRSNVYKDIQRAAKRIGRPDVSPHTLRHTFATRLIAEKGESVKAVSLYLGHASTSTTESMYVHDELNLSTILRGMQWHG